MMRNDAPFTDRRQAGRILAKAVAELPLVNPLVLALPRGGVPVAYEVAQALGAPLDLLMVRKIGAPSNKEFGIGAVVDGSAKQIVIDQDMARAVGANQDYLETEIEAELIEIERRRSAYGLRAPIPVEGRAIVLVDDGIATGNTVKAALQALDKTGAGRVVLAVPVAPQDTLTSLRNLCDDLVCLAAPDPFYAVGAHYVEFGQTSDEEVIALLRKSRELTEGRAA